MTPRGECGVQATFEQIRLKVRPSCPWGASRPAGQDTQPLPSQVFDLMGNDSSYVQSCCDSPRVGSYIALQTQPESEVGAVSFKRAVDAGG